MMNPKIWKTLVCSMCLATYPAARVEAQPAAPFFGGILNVEDKRVMDEAKTRIEIERKRPVTLKLRRGAGQAAPTGAVEVELVRHGFPFGINAGRSHQNGRYSATVEKVSGELFNRMVGGGLWGEQQKQIDGPHQFAYVDYKLRLAEKLGMDSRYHALFYFRDGSIPPRWSSEVASEAAWWRLMEEHLKAVGERYGDTFAAYDVHEAFRP